MASFWTLLILLLTPLITINTQAKHHNKLPSAIVVGTIYCHTCSLQTNHFIAGASVEIQCKKTSSRENFRQEVKTNSQGEFNVVLPFPVTKHAKNIRGCSVRLLTTNHPSCDAVSSPPSSSLHLKSSSHTTRVFSAAVFWSKHPQNCNKNTPVFDESKEVTDQLPFVPPFLPPNPLLPPPSILPPNPFQPPPSLIPPIFPTPPPSLFPPILPTPPFNFPPIPGLVPSPPPPPPPILPIPLPPFPFQPTPGFPGVPPAKVSTTSSP